MVDLLARVPLIYPALDQLRAMSPSALEDVYSWWAFLSLPAFANGNELVLPSRIPPEAISTLTRAPLARMCEERIASPRLVSKRGEYAMAVMQPISCICSPNTGQSFPLHISSHTVEASL